MSCDVMKQRKGWRMSCGDGKRRKGWSSAHFPTFTSLHLRHSFLQPFCRFTYVTAHSPTLPPLYLRHSSFSNPSSALPTSQLILQPLFRFSYVTGSSLTSPGETPKISIENWYRLSLTARDFRL